MKKVISFLSSISLITTTTFSIIGCQQPNNEDSNPIFPFPDERPTTLDKIPSLLGPYYDLSRNYMDLYWEIELPKGIKAIDSTNWQNSNITYFISTGCFEFIGYQLGQRGGFHFKTPEKRNYYGIERDDKSLKELYYHTFMEDESLTNQSKEEVTKWYNWALNEY